MPANPYYTEEIGEIRETEKLNEIKKLKESALQKMRDIQKRSVSSPPKPIDIPKEKAPIPEENQIQPKKSPCQTQNHSNVFNNFAASLFKDPDKSLILILIVILMDNEDNLAVILALLYILI